MVLSSLAILNKKMDVLLLLSKQDLVEDKSSQSIEGNFNIEPAWSENDLVALEAQLTHEKNASFLRIWK